MIGFSWVRTFVWFRDKGRKRKVDSLFLRDVTRNNWLDGLGEFGETSMQGVGLVMYHSIALVRFPYLRV